MHIFQVCLSLLFTIRRVRSHGRIRVLQSRGRIRVRGGRGLVRGRALGSELGYGVAWGER